MLQEIRLHLRRAGISLIVIGTGIGLCACTRNLSTVSREVGARPRVEQLALSAAMDDAYGDIDFEFVSDKDVFVSTRALSKTDVNFITSYVQKKVVLAGGRPVVEKEGAQLELTNTIEVSGTDEVQKRKRGVLIGQFKGTLSVVEIASGRVEEIYELNSIVKTKRTQRGKTRVIN